LRWVEELGDHVFRVGHGEDYHYGISSVSLEGEWD
jgi:hypothetical protein